MIKINYLKLEIINMISEETVAELKCATSDHFVVDPLSLSNCDHSICKKCAPQGSIKKNKMQSMWINIGTRF